MADIVNIVAIVEIVNMVDIVNIMVWRWPAAKLGVVGSAWQFVGVDVVAVWCLAQPCAALCWLYAAACQACGPIGNIGSVL